MKTAAAGLDMIKRFEGLELEAYRDIAGVWTIGYGHTAAFKYGALRPDSVITEHEAEALLAGDLGAAEKAVGDLVSVRLKQNEFDALVSLVHNIGRDNFAKSTVRRRVNAGDRIGAAGAFMIWNKAHVGGVLREVAGLTRRRAAEAALFLAPADETGAHRESTVRPSEPGGGA